MKAGTAFKNHSALDLAIHSVDAVRAGRLDRAPGDVLLDQAVDVGVITGEERQRVVDADVIRDEVIQVDSFDPEAYRSLRG